MKKKRFSKKLALNKSTVANLGSRDMTGLRGGVIGEFCLTDGQDSCNQETQVPDCLTDPPTLCKTCPCTDRTVIVEICPCKEDSLNADCQIHVIGIDIKR